jgi:hypothetical protein
MSKFTLIALVAGIISIQSCTSVKQIGDINMVSSRNVDKTMDYVLLRSYMGGNKKEIKDSKKLEIGSLENAINKVVKETPGGEFLKNVKIYLIDGKYIAVEGDVWGTAGVKENYRGISLNDHVIYKNGGSIFKGSIVALKNDQICFFQEFGSPNIIQIGYDNITKTAFAEKEIEEYIALKKSKEEKKKEPLINIFKKS